MSSNQLPFSEVIEFYKSEETQSVLDQFLNQVEHFFCMVVNVLNGHMKSLYTP